MNNYILKVAAQSNSMLNDSYNLFGDVSFYRDEDDDKPPYCFFLSEHLDDLTVPDEIWARALTLAALYNGATNLSYNPKSNQSPSKMEIVGLYIWENFKNITPTNSYEISQSKPFSSLLLATDLTKGTRSKTSLTIHLSKSNEDVLNLLLQLGNGLNWVCLYSVLDSIKFYSKKKDKKLFQRILKASGFNDKKLKEFTGTANNYGLLGVQARHGVTGTGIPSSTMNLPDAQNFIIKLCNEYLKDVHNC